MYSGDGEQAGKMAEMGGGIFLTSSMNGVSARSTSKSAVWVATSVRRFSDWC